MLCRGVSESAKQMMNERQDINLSNALRQHCREYFMEATGLCVFMISACLFTALIFHPSSPVKSAVENPLLARTLMGAAMGLTAVCIIYSPIGGQSGAHINPATTLMFLRLGKISFADAVWYIAAQFVGGIAGVLISSFVLGKAITHPSVNYAVTTPGDGGAGTAFIAEMLISFLLMQVVLIISNTRRLSRFTGIFVGLLVAAYISFESPLSGMSMNPARTLGSAIPSHVFNGLWIYFTAPPLGMLLAAETYLRVCGLHSVLCAKLNHHTTARCIFRCNFQGETTNR